MSNQCNIYEKNLLLQGVKSQRDLADMQKYCNAAQAINYGPNFAPAQQQPVMSNKNACPFKPLSSAYLFNGAPTPVDRKPPYGN
jgi:hypothetical protein